MRLLSIDHTLLHKQDPAAPSVFGSALELPHCIMKWDWGQWGWTGPIVCRGEGVIGLRWFGLLEGGSPLWMERKEKRAGQSQPLGIRVELEWPIPRIRCLPNRAQRVSGPGPSLWRSGLKEFPIRVMLDTLTLFPQGALRLQRNRLMSHLSLAHYRKGGMSHPTAATLI